MVSGFLGVLGWLRKQGWAMQGEAVGSGHQVDHSPLAPHSAPAGQLGRLGGEGTSLRLPMGASSPGKAWYNLEVAERALNSPRHFCDVGWVKTG